MDNRRNSALADHGFWARRAPGGSPGERNDGGGRAPLVSQASVAALIGGVYLDDAAAAAADEIELAVRQPTSTEQLRSVGGRLPLVIWMLCALQLVHHVCYFGVTGVVRNYLTWGLPQGGNGAGAVRAGSQETAGALGVGTVNANTIISLDDLFFYIVPVVADWLAESRLGRIKTVTVGVWLCFIAHLTVLFVSIPPALRSGHATPPFIVGLLMLTTGSAFIRSSLYAVFQREMKAAQPYKQTLETGETVIIDTSRAASRAQKFWYFSIYIAHLTQFATPFAARYVGYWLAFLIPVIGYIYAAGLWRALATRLRETRPRGSQLSLAITITACAIWRSKGKLWHEHFWHNAKYSILTLDRVTTFCGKPISWSDQDVDDISITFLATQVFAFWSFYSITSRGIGVIANLQSSGLTTNGVPNDLLSGFYPLTIFAMYPIKAYMIEPLLVRYKIQLYCVPKVATGFLFCIASGFTGMIIQIFIYKRSPCGHFASECNYSNGPSALSVWLQVPMFVLAGIADCFAVGNAFRVAENLGVPRMTNLHSSAYLLSNALGSLVSLVFSPAVHDPSLVWLWAMPAGVLFVLTVSFAVRWGDLKG